MRPSIIVTSGVAFPTSAYTPRVQCPSLNILIRINDMSKSIHQLGLRLDLGLRLGLRLGLTKIWVKSYAP